jgi:Kef-type K+ transport system membrane component KefB
VKRFRLAWLNSYPILVLIVVGASITSVLAGYIAPTYLSIPLVIIGCTAFGIWFEFGRGDIKWVNRVRLVSFAIPLVVSILPLLSSPFGGPSLAIGTFLVGALVSRIAIRLLKDYDQREID